MGCWLKTCALSNLPIYYGEDTYVFILQTSPDTLRGMGCSPSYLYSPLLLPFESTYDDYGGGENSSGYALPIVMNALKESLIEKEVGENEYHDIAVKREDWGEELLFKSVWADRLEIKTYYGKAKVKFVMMRKDVVDAILDDWVIEEYVGWDEEQRCGIYQKYKFQDVLNDIDPFLERCAKIRTPGLGIQELEPILEELAIWTGDCKDNKVAKWLQNPGGEWDRSFFRVSTYLAKMLADGRFEEAKPFIEVLLRGLFVDSFMDSTRRLWVPPCGEGSQSADFNEHKLMANVILGRIKALEEEYGEVE